MQFSKILLFATAAAIATAAPTGVLETRDEYKVSKHNGKWQKGWEDTEPSEQYICQTTGLLVCVSILSPDLHIDTVIDVRQFRMFSHALMC